LLRRSLVERSGRITMKSVTVWIVVAAVFGSVLLALGCSVPHRMVSKEDAVSRDWNDPSLERRVLIASRSSEFKDEVVERVEEGLRNEDLLYVKVIGVEALEQEDVAPYHAVILVNTCMAWKMDPKIEAFLKKQASTDRMIVLTTSGDGEWMPKKKEMEFDVVTSASEEYDPQAVADQIVDKVKRLLREPLTD
jgi:hypothetical protein